jgi:hypothetical protein
MAAAALFCRIVLIAECAALALAISSYCMPPASAATSFYGLCRDIFAADPLSQCAPGLELLGFGVDVSMCKSYGCRPSVDFDKDFVNKEVNMCCSPAYTPALAVCNCLPTRLHCNCLPTRLRSAVSAFTMPLND